MRILALAIALLTLPVAAQDSTPGPQGGDHALLFTFNGLNLGSFEGGFGAKKWTSPSTALTFGLNLDASRSEEEATEMLSATTRSYVASSLGVGMEFHSVTGGRFTPFVGIGTGAGVERRSFQTVASDQSGGLDRTSTTLAYSVHARLGVGVEYRFSERFSISGRQDLRGGLHWGTRTEEQDGQMPEEQPDSGWSVGTGASSLTLGVYF